MTGYVAARRVLVAVLCGVLVAAVLSLWWSGPADTVAAAPGDTSVEAGFSRDMAVHHQQAVEMSLIVRDRTADEAVRTLAYDILNTQATQRGMLLGWLEAWGVKKSSSSPPMTWMDHGSRHGGSEGALMPGMATDRQLDQLRKAKAEAAEVLYLRLMTAHHEGGVDMARGAVQKAGEPKVKRLARTMVDGQQSEIDLMADMLAQRNAGRDDSH